MSEAAAHKDGGVHDEHDHHEVSFWKQCVFSTDHKVIGLQYGFTALLFLAFGFFLIMVMRWSIAYPGPRRSPARGLALVPGLVG